MSSVLCRVWDGTIQFKCYKKFPFFPEPFTMQCIKYYYRLKKNRVVLNIRCWQLCKMGEEILWERVVYDMGNVTERNHQTWSQYYSYNTMWSLYFLIPLPSFIHLYLIRTQENDIFSIKKYDRHANARYQNIYSFFSSSVKSYYLFKSLFFWFN